MKKIIIILALFIFIASMGCVSAFDNSTILIPIDPDQGDFNELQGIIDNVGQGDSISLTKDFYNVENGSEISIINKTIAIDGNGHTLNASFESRIFNIDKNSVVHLSNIKFTGGSDGYQGGAIYSDGQLVLSYCEFIYNAGYFGGAVYSRNSLHVYNSAFNTNYADSGGAIYSLGDLIVENSVFMDNYAEYSAGAIFCLRADTIIASSKFNNNDAEYYGGSVHGGQILSISDSMFTSTNDAVEIMDYYCTAELPDAYLYLENNFMDSPCPYSIYYESLNPIASPVTLEYANKTTAEGLKTEVAKIYDDMGNIIRYNDNFTMEICGEGTLVEEVALSYDEEMGGYFYLCDLGDGTYTLTGTLPNQFAENLTVIDGELIVENSTVKMPSEVWLICNILDQ